MRKSIVEKIQHHRIKGYRCFFSGSNIPKSLSRMEYAEMLYIHRNNLQMMPAFGAVLSEYKVNYDDTMDQ